MQPAFEGHPDWQADPKAGQCVRNERYRQWGQVVWDQRKYQFESGNPGEILVWDFDRRGKATWAIDDLSLVAHLGKILWHDPTLADRLDLDWRHAEENWRGGAEETADAVA